MRRTALFGLAALLIAVPALSNSFEDATLKFKIDAPAGYKKADQAPPIPDVLGELKVAFNHADRDKNGGQMFLHLMPIPATEFEDFKTSLDARLQEHFGDGYRFIKRDDIELAGRQGFILEFQCPGDGLFPTQGGTTPHHVRWVLVKEGQAGTLGVLCHSRETAWKELEPGFATALKSAKAL